MKTKTIEEIQAWRLKWFQFEINKMIVNAKSQTIPTEYVLEYELDIFHDLKTTP